MTGDAGLITAAQIAMVRDYLLGLQQRICSGLEAIDQTGKFHTDAWERRRELLTRFWRKTATLSLCYTPRARRPLVPSDGCLISDTPQ